MADREMWTWFEGEWREGNTPILGAADHGTWLGSMVFDGARAFAEAIRNGMRNPGNVDDETVELVAANVGNPERLTGMLHYYRALIRGGGARRQSRRGYPEIETPTLMLWGVNDLALTVETTFATHRYVRDLTLRYLPEASHFVQQDAPVLVNRLLCAYLRGEPVPESGEAEGMRVTTAVPKT